MRLFLIVLCVAGAAIDAFGNATWPAPPPDRTLAKRALQTEHEKSRAEKWMDKFYGKDFKRPIRPSLVNLIFMVTKKYLSACIPVILYDASIYAENHHIFKYIFRKFPVSFLHGEIVNGTVKQARMLDTVSGHCRSYLILLQDVMSMRPVLRKQNADRVMLVSWSSQWRVHDFLRSEISQRYINLLVVGQSIKNSLTTRDTFILYTHQLFVDGLGSSAPMVLTSWANNALVRAHVDLFPPKMHHGFAGHRFIVAVAHRPPFVIKRIVSDSDGGNQRVVWDGLEYRLVEIISALVNFTLEFREVTDPQLSPGDSVTRTVQMGLADVGLAGVYVTAERLLHLDLSHGHSQDCASFISLASTALPRYRAIMGPFHWSVWVVLTFTYMFAILPLSYSDKHSFRHLIDNPGDIEDMFWYVFGTFTNCFTFTGEQAWSRSTKVTTRLLVGMYWAFTIIITACYTGSIIAFVTLPVFPQTVDNTQQLYDGGYRIITLDRGGWEHWFQNSTDELTTRLFRHLQFVRDIGAGLRNVTHAFFWQYSFLGSKAELDYVVRTNFSSLKGRRALLHISEECFVPFTVAMVFPPDSVYKTEVNHALLQITQSGILTKILNDVKWQLLRSTTGKLLQAGSGASLRLTPPEDKALTLDDTQGMFLLLAAGFLIAGATLFSEYVGGCVNYCKRKRFFRRKASTVSDTKSFHISTPRAKQNQVEYNHFNNESVSDIGKNCTSNCSIERTTLTIHAVPTSSDERMNEVMLEAGTDNEHSSLNSSQTTDFEKDFENMFNLDELFGEETVSIEEEPVETFEYLP